MKNWIMELCPEIAEWQAKLIAEQVQMKVAAEREACALVLDKVIEHLYLYNYDGDASTELRKCAKAIRARGEA